MNEPLTLHHITDFIHHWMADLSNNAIEPGADRPAFQKPIIGIGDGIDDLFSFLKEDIGKDFYWTPVEAFHQAYPDRNPAPEELSVISWVLPHTKETRLAHRKMTNMPSIEWSKARHYGETVNENLRKAVVTFLQSNNIQACAPAMLPQWEKNTSQKYGFASSWSERHTAHVCGLGTFGLSDGLITPAGKAIRVGSVIGRIKLSPTPREYQKHDEWCLYTNSCKCLACARRCPAGAISKDGHDKEKCKKYIREITAQYVEQEQLGFRVNSCGLCQTKVPCENRNPYAKL